MCVLCVFMCVCIPQGVDLTLPWKCLNILITNGGVTASKQGTMSVCLWFFFVCVLCICVCSLN